MGYTKGPWKVISAEFTDKGVAYEVLMPKQEICAANAQLIAAAPKLYEALKDFGLYVAVNYDKDNKPFYYIDQEWHDKRNKAIAEVGKC